MEHQCEELWYKEVGTLLASDAEAHDYFGTSVTVAGNRLVVGAHGVDTVGVNTGKVYVYDWNGSAYIEVAQLTASDAQANDGFGIAVALSGDRLVVGAQREGTAAVAAGKVYVYDWNGSAYVEVAQLTASDAHAYDYFGISVALSGNRLVVGAYVEDTATPNTGKVYVYDWDGTAYIEVAQLTASDAQAYGLFGGSVALSGNSLVVGAHRAIAPGVDDTGVDTTAVDVGKLYVYDWNGIAYIEVAQLTASDAQAGDQFGRSVSLSGDRLVVGAYFENSAGPDAGKAYVYDWNSAISVYDEVAQLTASDAQASDLFGVAVAVDDERLLVGAYARNASLAEAGKVYIYDRNGTE